METDSKAKSSKTTALPSLEAFFQAVERRTTNPVHIRLLKTCRESKTPGAVDAELTKIISEIADEGYPLPNKSVLLSRQQDCWGDVYW
jgi:hypothetical protein